MNVLALQARRAVLLGALLLAARLSAGIQAGQLSVDSFGRRAAAVSRPGGQLVFQLGSPEQQRGYRGG